MEGTPVLIVSGFLGSGKTTLVRRLLDDAQARGLRMAVISNEFGDLGIDEAMLGGGEMVELSGGCVCCSLSNELRDGLQRIYEKVRPDRIVVETSGLALPYDTQIQLWREPVRRWVGDDAAVVVVNAEQLAEGRDLEGPFEDQVSGADLIILNKVDLADGPELDARLAERAPGVPVIRAVRGEVDPDLLFGPGKARGEPPAHGNHAHHHEAFVASELRFDGDVSLEELRVAVAGSLRSKGFVRTAEGPRLLQGVGKRLEFAVPRISPPPELLGRVVVIRRA